MATTMRSALRMRMTKQLADSAKPVLTTRQSFAVAPAASAARAYSSKTTPNRPYSSATATTQANASSADSSSSPSSNSLLIGAAVAAILAGAGWYTLSGDGEKGLAIPGLGSLSGPKDGIGSFADYQRVYNDIANLLEKNPDYDDGSYGPVLVRLAWHASGTYDKKEGSGGSNGATMRFAPESNHGANAGLIHAREFMDELHKKYSWLTYSDLWTLGGVVAVQELGGPKVAWRPGRSDKREEHCTPDGRLPDGDKGPDHLRSIFYRMGFNDQEIVALSGAHALGRCHPDRSGFEGPWTHSPISFTNEYFNLLLKEKWSFRKWDGPKQYQDKSTGSLMMLTTDMALVQDKSFRKYVEKYAKSEDAFFEDFAKAYAKLLELGVPAENFKKFETQSDGGRPFVFKTTAEQENEQSKK